MYNELNTTSSYYQQKAQKHWPGVKNGFWVKFAIYTQDDFNIQIYLLCLCSKILYKHLSSPYKEAIFIYTEKSMVAAILMAKELPCHPHWEHGWWD